MIWGHKDYPYRQIPIDHWDITAIVTELLPAKRMIFLASIYILSSQKKTKD